MGQYSGVHGLNENGNVAVFSGLSHACVMFFRILGFLSHECITFFHMSVLLF